MQLQVDGGSKQEHRAGTQMRKPHGFVCTSEKNNLQAGLRLSLGKRKWRKAEGGLLLELNQ